MAALIPSHADCEIRSVIKFLNVQSIAPIEIHRQLCEVYGPDVLSKQMVRRWCRQFTGGRQNVHDEARSGRPSIVTDDLVEQVRQRIEENRRFTIRELSSHFPQISRSSLHEIVSKHLLFRKLCPSTHNKKKRKPAKKRRAASESDKSSEASKEADENMSEFDADQAEVTASISSEDAGLSASMCNTEMHEFDEITIKSEPIDETHAEDENYILGDLPLNQGIPDFK